MALRQANAGMFPYYEHVKVDSGSGSGTISYEFEQDTILHGLSASSTDSTSFGVQVKYKYPRSFTTSVDAEAVMIFDNAVPTGPGAPGLSLSTMALHTDAIAPLPTAFPKGSILEVEANTDSSTPVTLDVFLVASAGPSVHY